MLQTIGLILLFIGVLILQVPDLARKKSWKELALFTVLFTLAVVYSFGQVLEIKLPNPTRVMEYLSVPAWMAIEKVFPQ